MTSMDNHNALADREMSTTIIECVIFSLMFVTALVGNLFVCLAFFKNPTLNRSLNNYFIISLAASDILMALLVEPLTFGVFYNWAVAVQRCTLSISRRNHVHFSRGFFANFNAHIY
ncbi:G-protein coupled receptor 1 [Desmophyllum pertusum]|uniref:G-protein coupled receptor 1 n=1 Tax=Desmophyllum pertusum TaxID=174260 RepID=A0A9W9Z5C4_9CNID|nr:G-protein coupled receptor 1 [Desmophyllum pertusum]